MGLCQGNQRNAEKDEARVNELLQQHMVEDQKKNEMKVKLLLLGAGDSGKSTLFKQMKINYTSDYTPGDLVQETQRIINAFMESFAELIRTVLNHYSTMGSPELDNAVDEIIDPNGRVKKIMLNAHTVALFKKLWNSDYAREIWENRSKYQLVDSLAYFCKDIDRLAQTDYVPTEKDYLLCRIRSTGIIEQTFMLNRVKFQIVDVGGQRSERRKWVQCFDGVTAVLFVAAISEFNQKLFEDNHVDRIYEARTLFQKTMNFKAFKGTSFILFLNKLDLFEEKLQLLKNQGEDLDKYWPELKLGKNYAGASDKIKEFYQKQFLSASPDGGGRIYPYYVTATDKTLFKTVFKTVANIILTRAIDFHFDPNEAV